MAEANVAKIDDKKFAPVPMKTFIHGRIDTQVITPAPDAYSRPQIVEIRGKSVIGDVGDEVSVFAMLGGFSKSPFDSKDKNTGEIIKVYPVSMTLDLIED